MRNILTSIKKVITDIKGILHNSSLYEGIHITGNKEFVVKTINALILLKKYCPEELLLIKNYIDEISAGSYTRINVDPIGFNGSAWCIVGKAANSPTPHYAGILAHEVFHAKLYYEYRKNNPNVERVPDDIYTGEEAEKNVLNTVYMYLKNYV